jgi:hypothetical protein
MWAKGTMTKRILALLIALVLPTAALADCADDACNAVQKILAARGSFAKIKGKPTLDPRGDPVWEGTQPIGDLIKACYVNKRGEGSRYEYRCDTGPMRSAEKAKKIADEIKAALQAADAKLVWFDDPAAAALAAIDGFHGTAAWYGGYAKDKAMLAKVELVISDSAGSAVIVTVFAKPITRRDLK